MRILALDTATEGCSVALALDGEIIESCAEPGNGHASMILPMIDALLARAGIPLGALEGIAVGIGPGAFTGVRIGVSVAQGLAFAVSLPVMPVNSLEALAMNFLRDDIAPVQVLACLDARMGEVYWAVYMTHSERGVAALCPPRVDPPGQVGVHDSGTPIRGIGRGFRAYPQLAQIPRLVLAAADAGALPQAAQMVRIALIRAKLGEWIEPAQLQPLYLRDKVARTEQERAAESNAAS